MLKHCVAVTEKPCVNEFDKHGSESAKAPAAALPMRIEDESDDALAGGLQYISSRHLPNAAINEGVFIVPSSSSSSSRALLDAGKTQQITIIK